MSKSVEYPRGSFKNGLEIATAVDYLGGSCSIVTCAHRLNKKVSGAFKDLISSAVKHNLITSKKDVLSTTELYRIYKLAYDETEKLNTLRTSFLSPQLYTKVYKRFEGNELPVSMLDKLIIREFGVDENVASKVSGYFVDGLKSLKMMEDGKLIKMNNFKPEENEDIESIDVDNEDAVNSESNKNNQRTLTISPTEYNSFSLPTNSKVFSFMIVGPGINTKIEINEEDDLLILDAMINKIKKRYKNGI